MITKEEYEAAKKIVEAYEYAEYLAGMAEAEDDDLGGLEEDECDPLEQEWEGCTCGAYAVSPKTGKIIKLSDCYC